jgi:hypothetical protein
LLPKCGVSIYIGRIHNTMGVGWGRGSWACIEVKYIGIERCTIKTMNALIQCSWEKRCMVAPCVYARSIQDEWAGFTKECLWFYYKNGTAHIYSDTCICLFLSSFLVCLSPMSCFSMACGYVLGYIYVYSEKQTYISCVQSS